MAFTDVTYTTDLGFTCLCRMRDSEATAVGASTETAPDATFHVNNGGGRREFGIRARGYRLTRTIGTAPNQFKRSKFLAEPDPTEHTAEKIGTEFTINGVAWTVAGLVAQELV